MVANPVKVEVPGKIEMREFFWYGSALLSLKPHMQTWLKKLPKDVRLVRSPGCNEHCAGSRAHVAIMCLEALGVRTRKLTCLYSMPLMQVASRFLIEKSQAKFFVNMACLKPNSTACLIHLLLLQNSASLPKQLTAISTQWCACRCVGQW